MSQLGRDLTAGFQKWTAGLHRQTVFVLVFSTVVLILFHENGTALTFRNHLAHYFGPLPLGNLFPAFYWFLCSFLMLGIVPALTARLGFRQSWSQIGIGLGDWQFGLPVVLSLFFAFLPMLVLISYHPDFQNKYPLFEQAYSSWTHLVLYEIAYAVYFIGWEYIYRGFLLFGLYPKLGYYAVFIQMIPFAIMHFGKPQIETLAAVAAGIILGYLALRARSFWYGWLLHVLVAVSNDILALLHKGCLPG